MYYCRYSRGPTKFSKKLHQFRPHKGITRDRTLESHKEAVLVQSRMKEIGYFASKDSMHSLTPSQLWVIPFARGQNKEDVGLPSDEECSQPRERYRHKK